ncbi:Plasmodium exported protein, unknown function [Plasmodium vinckei vinckei]|uniref:Uncharacterized protein n=1 Tax=Plasmodium vinckei vinckei TaxID=54757 RepID=A0A081I999_PLAVN|nr:Plasmodium exported protein, unknown function [Plasmodium vinckei vinckei]KEG00257.1 hypothetical protein YYE_04768 [Plasmodium vinckei vinckei]VEV54410.1 Plasmodium exported protein, unknown function [Plasmodium vinckei vinckei]
MEKTQTKKNNNRRRMANCSPLSGKLFILSIILILPYIVNYAPNNENSHNVSFSTNKDLKRFLAEPAEELELDLNNAPEDELEPNLEDNDEFEGEDDENNDVSSERDDDDYFSDPESCLASDSDYDDDDDMDFDHPSTLEYEYESDPEFDNNDDPEFDNNDDPEIDNNDDLEAGDESRDLEAGDESRELGARPKFFRKSRQNNNALHRARANDVDSDDEFDDDEDNAEVAHAPRNRPFRKPKNNNNEEDQVEEGDIDVDRAMAEESLGQLFSNIDPEEIQNAFLSSLPFMINLGGFGNLANANALTNDENDPKKQAKIDEKVNTVDKMLEELIDDFNLSESIQENMADIQNVAQQLQHDPKSVSPVKLVKVIASLANSIAQSCLDENGEIDPNKAEASAHLMKEKLDKIVDEANKPISED